MQKDGWLIIRILRTLSQMGNWEDGSTQGWPNTRLKNKKEALKRFY